MPGVYWLAVVLISVVGTLVSDNLVDNLGVALQTTTIAFSICLAATFAAWYASERTLSIHTIVTTRRESFYWLAVLFTFALGTSAGDLVAEQLGLGYGISVLIFAALIGIVTLAHFRFSLNAVLAFWVAYILTRPLGASIGDLMSQPKADGGLGLGTTVTSFIFLATILALVIYLTVTKVDLEEVEEDGSGHLHGEFEHPHPDIEQTAARVDLAGHHGDDEGRDRAEQQKRPAGSLPEARDDRADDKGADQEEGDGDRQPPRLAEDQLLRRRQPVHGPASLLSLTIRSEAAPASAAAL